MTPIQSWQIVKPNLAAHDAAYHHAHQVKPNIERLSAAEFAARISVGSFMSAKAREEVYFLQAVISMFCKAGRRGIAFRAMATERP